jgi:SAM-dependent methyltransferase
VDGPQLRTLTVRRGSAVIAQTAIDVACPELAAINLPSAATSRFDTEAVLDPAHEYEFFGDDGLLFAYRAMADDLPRMQQLAAAVAAMTPPTPELVAVTQGGGDVTAYTDSAVSSFLSIEALLRAAGHDPAAARRVLDVGCGTGRLLLGWHAADRTRHLVGADINGSLIDWSRAHLADVAEWHTSHVAPPLPFDDASFDVIQLASVFTHLPLDLQRTWLAELRRLVRPGGAILLTLHGEVYSRLLLDDASRAAYAQSGYAEFAGAEPGANAFATFHSEAFARGLFAEFADVRLFPRGNDPERPSLFPIAALQDVYVLTR